MSVAEATRDNFRDLVAEGTVLVDVWGPQCKECLVLMPEVERIAGELELALVKLEAPKARRICIELKVMGMPTLLLLKNGQEVSRVGGQALTGERVREWLDSELSPTPG
ncbi:MAG TPA: thioredoxin family protein [Candidatus Dormibacteraeota bacterium]